MVKEKGKGFSIVRLNKNIYPRAKGQHEILTRTVPPRPPFSRKPQTEIDWKLVTFDVAAGICRGKVSFVMRKYVLSRESKFCREKVSFTVEK